VRRALLLLALAGCGEAAASAEAPPKIYERVDGEYMPAIQADVRVFHDKRRRVTCWVLVPANGYRDRALSCLPDSALPKEGP
jgi:hypothetical protein